jgi:SAM-dependent methyltransferase
MAALSNVFKRLVGLPLLLGTSRMSCGAHVTRYQMYETLKTVINDPTRGAGKKVLSISHSDVLIPCLGIERATIIEANYPEFSATNLSAFCSEDFDFVVSDQVLEHVEGNPQEVFDETFRLLKRGGIAVHTTCFINPIHGWPSDFWRFTPSCLAMLAKQFSEIIEIGGFGNRAIWIVDFLGLRWTPVPHAKWHPLHKLATINQSDWPTSTWIVAKK